MKLNTKMYRQFTHLIGQRPFCIIEHFTQLFLIHLMIAISFRPRANNVANYFPCTFRNKNAIIQFIILNFFTMSFFWREVSVFLRKMKSTLVEDNS